MDMTSAEITWVTNHMGHTKDVHFNWYRKEDATIELSKIAKVLTAVNEGKSLKNKKIDDVLSEVDNADTEEADDELNDDDEGSVDFQASTGIDKDVEVENGRKSRNAMKNNKISTKVDVKLKPLEHAASNKQSDLEPVAKKKVFVAVFGCVLC